MVGLGTNDPTLEKFAVTKLPESEVRVGGCNAQDSRVSKDEKIFSKEIVPLSSLRLKFMKAYVNIVLWYCLCLEYVK